MCSQALEEGASGGAGNVPKAFQASILFLMSMPFILLAAFSAAFYRMYRKGLADSPVEVIEPTRPVALQPSLSPPSI